ncbi:hypothetical protein BT63DRAFT_151080 [Microthyrium microscopicum]|uniref:Cell wall anchored protein n=1 Tax=Microthyrium microscopicum TaxID=703497 RepID=A0A6A6ULS9_9PEZI|nr:hypothetical protein BT63DRAFT_151080 [Microthyrium microscopicum]
MVGSIILSLLATISFLVQPSIQQKDPLKDFCRRFGHQTALIDNKLFIDGGLINWNPLDQNPINYTNTNLLYADITVNNQGMPQEYQNLTKPAQVPSVSGGTLWPDTVNKKFYLYGGEFQSSPASFSMWSYDALYNNWTSVNPDPTQSSIQRASFGASTVAQDRGLGYWYGGWLSNLTVPVWGPQPLALSNMLTYDMVNNVWTNSSGPDSIGRAEGIMLEIPISDGGMLVYFGGVQTPSNNGTWVGQPLDTIFLYDIAGGKWYTQKATGDVPDMRRRFCGGAVWAADQSSYNIYLYGGASMPPNTSGFDDIYILSIPSFTWIKWYPTAPGAAYPHHSLTCNVINGDQMIVMGGTFPNASTCDAPGVYGFHNMDLGKQNPDNAKWYQFQNNKTSYQVPSEIVAVVGGDGSGSATKKAPDAGFGNPDLSVYMTRKASAASTRTATRAIPKSTGTSKGGSSSHTGAIIGGAVAGGVIVLVLVSLLVFCCLKRRKTQAPQQEYQQNPQNPHEAYQHTDPYNPSPHHGYIPVYQHGSQQNPVQLPANEQTYMAAPAELSAHDDVGVMPKPYQAVHQEKEPEYSYSSTSPHQSPPQQSPPMVTPQQYFPPPSNSPAPAYNSPGHSPGQGAYPQQASHYTTPSPPNQYGQPHYTPNSASPSGFVPSPIGNPPQQHHY